MAESALADINESCQYTVSSKVKLIGVTLDSIRALIDTCIPFVKPHISRSEFQYCDTLIVHAVTTRPSHSGKLWSAQDMICTVYRTTISSGYKMHITLWLVSFVELLTVLMLRFCLPRYIGQ